MDGVAAFTACPSDSRDGVGEPVGSAVHRPSAVLPPAEDDVSACPVEDAHSLLKIKRRDAATGSPAMDR
jgi:hypothetical protein